MALNATPVIDPDQAVARVAKMLAQARDALDQAFGGAEGKFSETHPDIYAQVLALMHQDYIEAIRIAQRDAERQP